MSVKTNHVLLLHHNMFINEIDSDRFFSLGWFFLGRKINGTQMGVSKNRCTPKSSILIGFSLIFTIHFGGFYPNFWKHPNMITTDCPPVSNDLRGILFPNFFYSPDPISRVCSTLFHLSQRRLGVDKFAGFPRFGGMNGLTQLVGGFKPFEKY